MLKNPARQDRLNKVIEELHTRYATAKPLVEHYTTLNQNSTALKASADAAEADAQRLRGEVRELLTKLIGRPSKELRAKSAEQRAAIELADDYRELSEGMQDDIIVAQLDANRPARDSDAQRRKLRNTYAELLLEETLSDVAPQLCYVFRRLRSTMYFVTDDEIRVANLAGTTYNELVYRVISQAIGRAIDKVEPAAEPPEIIEALNACPAFSIKEITPGTQHNIIIGLEKRQKEREAQIAARRAS